MEAFGIVVIGAGPGGYSAAIRAAQLGASVALVEKEELGGTCLNWGCIPTKSLIASSDLYARVKSAGAMGLKVDGASFDYGAMADRKDQVVRTLRNGIKQLLKANGVKVFQGTASFQSRNRILVSPQASSPGAGVEPVILGAGDAAVPPASCAGSRKPILPEPAVAACEHLSAGRRDHRVRICLHARATGCSSHGR